MKLGIQRQQHARIHMRQSRTLYDLLLGGIRRYRKDCEVVYGNKTKPYYDTISTTTNQHALYQIGRLYCALVKQRANTANYYGNQHHHTLRQILPPFFGAHYLRARDIRTESALRTHVLRQRCMGFLLYSHKVPTTIICGLYNGYHWDIIKHNMPRGRGSEKKGNSVRT